MTFLQKCKRIPKHLPRLLQSTLCLLLSFLLCDQCFGASLDSATLNFFNASDIHYYNPVGSKARNCYTGDINVAGNTIEEKIWSGLTSFMTEEQAAGTMGNMAHESNYFNPVQHEISQLNAHPNADIMNDASISYGIGLIQWSGSRRVGFLHYIESQNASLLDYFYQPNIYSIGYTIDGNDFLSLAGESVTDELLSLELQYLKDELDNNSSYNGIYNTTTVAEASDYFLMRIEQPRNISGNQPIRLRSAQQYYDQFKGKTFISSTNTTKTNGSNITIIGDSITVRSAEAIRSLLPNISINAEVGRTFAQGVEILQSMSNPRDIIIFALGSNDDTISQELAQEVLNIAGPNRIVIFVNNFSLGKHDYSQHNLLFEALAGENKNVFVADWSKAVQDEPEKYIASEGTVDVHPTISEGTELFAQTIYAAATNVDSKLDNLINCIRTYNGEGVPQYFQSDERWGHLNYGPDGIYGHIGTSIAASGCGPSSFAMMITAILGREITPDETSDIAGQAGQHSRCDGGWCGSSWTITAVLAEHYSVQYQNFDTNRSNCIGVIEAALADGWMIHTSGTGTKPFSSGGHYIGIVGVDQDGNWLTADSAGWGNGAYSPQEILNAGINCDNLKGIK